MFLVRFRVFLARTRTIHEITRNRTNTTSLFSVIWWIVLFGETQSFEIGPQPKLTSEPSQQLDIAFVAVTESSPPITEKRNRSTSEFLCLKASPQ
jgi:hypothetical protein